MTIDEAAVHVLDEIKAVFKDTRVNYCQVELAAGEGGALALQGAVLDNATLKAVQDGLRQSLPERPVDLSGVRVLRKPSPKMLTVATNLTHLHREPSWLSEMLSQIFNGWSLEVLIERDRWCFVRQTDGYLGWAYRPYLSELPAPEPTHILCEPVSLLYEAPDMFSQFTSRLLGGTAVLPAAINETCARVELPGDLCGWLPVAHLRSLADISRDEAWLRHRIVADARRWMGVPYLWGGCSANGIDCSGLAQLMHRLVGITIPRDADMQYNAGRPVEGTYQPGDLVFFGDDGDFRAITHVGISLGGWNIIHSSRSNNGVYEDDLQSVPHLKESLVGARTFIGR